MAGPLPMQAVVIDQAALTRNSEPMQLALFNVDGTPFTANQSAQMPVQAATAAMTQAAITGGESPTEAEFNALRADVDAIHTAVNALLTKLKTAGLMASA
jgi:hypothetical protein